MLEHIRQTRCSVKACSRYKTEQWREINNMFRRVWRYQRGNQNPYMVEEQTTQSPKEKVQKDKQRFTKHTYKTKDQVTRTPLITVGHLTQRSIYRPIICLSVCLSANFTFLYPLLFCSEKCSIKVWIPETCSV